MGACSCFISPYVLKTTGRERGLIKVWIKKHWCSKQYKSLYLKTLLENFPEYLQVVCKAEELETPNIQELSNVYESFLKLNINNAQLFFFLFCHTAHCNFLEELMLRRFSSYKSVYFIWIFNLLVHLMYLLEK